MHSTTSQEATSAAGKYLTVSLAQESYGIAVVKVREIIRLTKITPVPRMPEYVKGVLNLRGRVVPVIDLRVRFGLPAETDPRTCIVVVELRLASGKVIPMGLIVDNVDEVSAVAAAEIEPPPHLAGGVDTSYLLGLAKIKGQVKLLLDIDRVIAADAAEVIAHTA